MNLLIERFLSSAPPSPAYQVYQGENGEVQKFNDVGVNAEDDRKPVDETRGGAVSMFGRSLLLLPCFFVVLLCFCFSHHGSKTKATQGPTFSIF